MELKELIALQNKIDELKANCKNIENKSEREYMEQNILELELCLLLSFGHLAPKLGWKLPGTE